MYDLKKMEEHIPKVIGDDHMRYSAVLIPLIPDGDDYRVLFQIRSPKVEHQPGDVCFPGGKREAGETAEENVVRETMEELLVCREQIRILGPADILRCPGLIVDTFAGILTDYEGTFSSDEVADVFTVPLSYFLANEPEIHTVRYRVEMPDDFPFDRIHGGRNYGWRERKEDILFYEYEGRTIWGMTAKILHRFVEIVRAEVTDV